MAPSVNVCQLSVANFKSNRFDVSAKGSSKCKMAECGVGVVSNGSISVNTVRNVPEDEQTQHENTEKAMGRYLLEDYELDNPPKSLENLLDYFSSGAIELDMNDTFILLLYILTLETGFVPKELLDDTTDKSIDFTHSRVLYMTERFPDKWKGDKTYFIDFILPKCPSRICQLFCLVSDEDILATFRLKEDLIGYSHLFDPKAFVIGHRHFQNLRGLSVQFKDNVSFPVKTTILSMHNVQHSSLAFLPFELVVIIMGMLRESDIVNVGRTCRRFAKVLDDSKVQQVINRRRRSFDRKLQRVRSN